MKKFYLTGILIISLQSLCFSQEDNSKVDINFLKAPSSPAANLLGTAPSEIQTPGDPNALMASFQNATSNFVSLPKSFAVDIAPFWLFGGRNRTFSEYKSDCFKDNLKQSLVVSLAYRDSSNVLKGYEGNSMFGFGIKFSLIRGKANVEERINKFNIFANKIDSLSNVRVDKNPELAQLNNEADSLQLMADSLMEKFKSSQIKADSLLSRNTADSARKKRSEAILMEDKLKTELQISINNSEEGMARIKDTLRIQESFRTGFKWDIAGGGSYRYPQNSVDSVKFFRGGAWTTFGYEWAPKNKDAQASILCIIRGLRNPEQAWADNKGILQGNTSVTTGDIGLKASYLNTGRHSTNVSLEVLYRSIISKQDEQKRVEPSWRAAFNANYEVSKNVVLVLAIGRDFDGSISKSGNVFAVLNLITAFGSGTSILAKK